MDRKKKNDMEDGETGSTHSMQNVSQPRSSRWFRWCQALGRCRTRQRREIVYHALESQLAYTLHKPARRRLKHNRVIVKGKDEQWQADLVDVQALKKDNDGYRHHDSDDDFRSGCRNVGQCHQQQSFSGLLSPGRSNHTNGYRFLLTVIDVLSKYAW